MGPNDTQTLREMATTIDALQARVRELEAALKATAAVCAGETMSKSGLVNALELARAALEGKP